MLRCRPDTVLPMDPRVVAAVQRSPAFRFTLDEDYLRVLPDIHGGTPEKLFFTTPSGAVRQIGWLVSYLDDESPLPGPFEAAFYHRENDWRVDDRSIPAILNDEVNPFHDGERILPFAALFTDGSVPLSLRLYTLDSFPADSLCFDQSTSPHSVVVCDGRRASEEVVRWDDGEVEEVDYDAFIERVAGSFAEFVEMLREEPTAVAPSQEERGDRA